MKSPVVLLLLVLMIHLLVDALPKIRANLVGNESVSTMLSRDATPDPCSMLHREGFTTVLLTSLQGKRLRGLMQYCSSRAGFPDVTRSFVVDCEQAIWYWQDYQQRKDLSDQLGWLATLQRMCPVQEIESMYATTLLREMENASKRELESRSLILLSLSHVPEAVFDAFISANLAEEALGSAVALGHTAYDSYPDSYRILYLYGIALTKADQRVEGLSMLCQAYYYSPTTTVAEGYLQDIRRYYGSDTRCP